MKQYVDLKDSLSLDKNAYKKLDVWCKGKGYSVASLTIGQMIEFLSEWGMVGIKKTLFDKKWTVDFPMYFLDKEDKELCDALWEAVKDVLNENENNR